MNKFKNQKQINKGIIMKLSSLDVICATEHEEFYYEGSDEPVQEGEPVGLDIETGDAVELVLFSNIYWSLDN
jgi:hypothetical protein